ncbi:PKD domain-containing protein [Flavisolibacter sp. BT320]|nr:PKD domain-containing protein [Flavisolibacter longurius]
MKSKRVFLWLLLGAVVFQACKKEEKDDTDTAIEVIFESDRQEISAGDSIRFKDLSNGYVSKWKWTFEGGTPATSNLSSPTVKYTTPGVYAVTVELSNSSNTVLETKTDYIRVDYNQVKADFITAETVVYTGQPIVFKDSSTGGPKSWQWKLEPVSGGTTLTSTDQHPSLVFTDTGFYHVSLTATNPSYSDTKTKNNFIRVIDINAVNADFSSTETATYAGGSITFNDASLGTVTGWNWKVEGPITLTSQAQNPVFNFTTPGRYKVSLTASNSNRSHTKAMDDFVLVVPSDRLGAFLPFNGNVRDVGPNSLQTASVGAGVGFGDADRKAKQGTAGTFSGGSGVVVSDHSATNFGANDYSVVLWVKTAATNRMMLWQESGKNGSGDNQTWLRMGDNATTQFLRFAIEDATGSAILSMGAVAKLSDGQWHQVASVRSGTNTAVYIDGVKVGNFNAANLKVVSNAQNFKIGMQEGATANSNFFNGQMDDLLIYNKALAEAEILALLNL